MSPPQHILRDLLERFSGSLKWLEESGITRIAIPQKWQMPSFESIRSDANQVTTHEGEYEEQAQQAQQAEQAQPPVEQTSKQSAVARLLDEVAAPTQRADAPIEQGAKAAQEPTRVFADLSAVAPEAILAAIEGFLEEENVVDPQLKNEFKRTLLFEQLKSELVEQSVCPVCSGRQEVVLPTLGNRCKVVFIADEPDEREQLMGMPYVGETGSLVARMVKAMGLTRAEVGFAYINWCAHNEASAEDVADAWSPFLERYLALASPQAIVAFGECAARRLTGQTLAFPHLRGQWFDYKDVPVLPTFHPSALLQHPAGKSVVWGDLKNVMRKLGITAPKR
jgi:DNA polymerase